MNTRSTRGIVLSMVPTTTMTKGLRMRNAVPVAVVMQAKATMDTSLVRPPPSPLRHSIRTPPFFSDSKACGAPRCCPRLAPAGGFGNDTLHGGGGDDSNFQGNQGDDKLHAGEGNNHGFSGALNVPFARARRGAAGAARAPHVGGRPVQRVVHERALRKRRARRSKRWASGCPRSSAPHDPPSSWRRSCRRGTPWRPRAGPSGAAKARCARASRTSFFGGAGSRRS